MSGPQTQHKGVVYGDDETPPRQPGLDPPLRDGDSIFEHLFQHGVNVSFLDKIIK